MRTTLVPWNDFPASLRATHGLGAGLLTVCLIVPAARAQQGPASVEVAPVVQTELAETQPTLGTITPTRRAILGSAVDGRVIELMVREGDRVEENQPLAKLLTQTIELELEAAEAELELRKEELTELQNGNRPEEIAQAKARLEASGIAARFLEKNKERLTELSESNAVPLADLESSLSLWLEAQQRNLEAQSAYQLAVQGARPEKIKQAQMRVSVAKALAERLRDQLGKHTIYSRFGGYVTKELTEVGQWLSRGEPVAEVIALDDVFVEAKVIEAQIPLIQLGDQVTVEVPALGDQKFQGVVERIVPEADLRSRTFPVKVRVANQFSPSGQPALKSGMLARLALATTMRQSAFLVPKDALVLQGGSTMVWGVDPATITKSPEGMMEGSAVAIPVETGAEQKDRIAVSGPIQPGMLVVIRGNERITPRPPGSPPSRVSWRAPANANPANANPANATPAAPDATNSKTSGKN
jgi:HlyD family secretion protein